MKAVEIRDTWSLDSLTMTERPDPEPGPGELILAMRAATLNYRDALMVQGGYGSVGGDLPLIPLSDGVGEVIAVGDGVRDFSVGDRASPTFFAGWTGGRPTAAKFATSLGGPLDGVMAERMAVPAESAVKVAGHLTDIEAAAYTCAGVTAWSAVLGHGGVGPGDTVLVQGTGGVSLFALQFAKFAGARIIATSSSDEKLERVRAMGADEVINYKTTDKWGKLAAEMAGGDGVDLVVEVGGAGTLAQSVRAVKVGGQIGLIGVLGGARSELNLPLIVMRDIRLQGVTVGSRERFQDLMRAVAQHRSRPVMDKTFAFDELKPALEYLMAGRHFGKVAVGIG